MKRLAVSAVCAAAAIYFSTAQSAVAAGQIIAPISAVINNGGPGDGSIADTYNQNGLTSNYTPGVTDFDTYIATNPQHSAVFSGNEWFSKYGTSPAIVTYDLGALIGIDRLALWNEEYSGIGTLNLYGSTDGSVFSSLGIFNPINNPQQSSYGSQVFSFDPVSVKYVQFSMSGCPQPDLVEYTACAIGEVAFRSADVGAGTGAVPEPSTWAMMLVGFGSVGFVMRRRKGNEVSSPLTA